MAQRRRVALLIETSNDYARGLLHGVRAYVRERGSWSIDLGEHSRGEKPPSWLSRWTGDGIIARIENKRIARSVVESGRPAVDVSAARSVPSLPWVETDDARIAELAFDHLAERGFRHFGFCGDARFNWSIWRREYFQRLVAEAGCRCAVYERPARSAADWERDQRELGQWVQELPKPVGVMACYDARGRQVLEACRRVGVAVPDEVAVIGVDNDELLSDLADPPLSSVIPDSHRTGYTAATLLEQMMAGREVPAAAHRISPLGVVTRQSTDVLAIDDRHVSAAIRFIREHACEGLDVGQVVGQVPLSRRALEARFKRLLGRSPHEEIIRVRMDRARQLLCETDLPLTTVAERTGFRHPEYFSVAFKRHEGQSPAAFRRAHA